MHQSARQTPLICAIIGGMKLLAQEYGEVVAEVADLLGDRRAPATPARVAAALDLLWSWQHRLALVPEYEGSIPTKDVVLS